MIELIPTISCVVFFLLSLNRLINCDAKKRFKFTCAIIGVSYIGLICACITGQIMIIHLIVFICYAITGFFEILSLPNEERIDTNNE